MKKNIAVILCALMLCLVLASCASGGGVVGGEDVKDFFEDLFGDNDESKESEQTSDTEPVTDTEPATDTEPDNDDKNWTGNY